MSAGLNDRKNDSPGRKPAGELNNEGALTGMSIKLGNPALKAQGRTAQASGRCASFSLG